MIKFITKFGIISGIASLVIVGSAFAVGPKAKAEERLQLKEARLDAIKLKVCQKRETHINNTMDRVATRGEKQLDVFNKIATRTETFYTTKGKTLSNYDALVADVNAKKAAAEAAVAAVKSDSVTFKCDGIDPKGSAANFKSSLKTEIAALKAYKTAVKNLIVGVKSVQGTDSKTKAGQ